MGRLRSTSSAKAVPAGSIPNSFPTGTWPNGEPAGRESTMPKEKVVAFATALAGISTEVPFTSSRSLLIVNSPPVVGRTLAEHY